MKISIVTISYNQALFLERAICSVIDQGYQNIEYIVVDPGSTDGSREIIERYRDRITKIIYEPDRGPADGLNKGFAQATGEIFGFINSDDVLEQGTLTSVAKYFLEHPNVDVVSGNSWIIDESGEIKRRLYSDRFSLNMSAYGASVLAQQSTFFRATAFKFVGGFNVENKIAWDGELFIDMALAGFSFDLVPDFWSSFRIHQECISGTKKHDNLRVLYSDAIFQKIKGRKPDKLDQLFYWGARLLRKLFNPRDTVDRLLRGPIYNSSGKGGPSN